MSAQVTQEGSRIEVSGIRTLDDAAKALDALQSHESFPSPDAVFHCYLSGNSFSFWTDGTVQETEGDR